MGKNKLCFVRLLIVFVRAMSSQMEERHLRFLDSENIPNSIILTDDPMRVKMLVAHYLESAVLSGERRCLFSYTGKYRGVDIAVISSGFGETAAETVLHEAARLGARDVIYMGECISLSAAYELRQVVIAAGGDEDLLKSARAASLQSSIPVHIQDVVTFDRYYLEGFKGETPDGILDFATGGVYRYAEENGLAALSLLTVSENALTGERIDESERQSRFHSAAVLAFETLATRA